MFGIRKRLATDDHIEEYVRQLKDLEQRFDAYAQVIQTLLTHLKDFSMDISDIDGEGFRNRAEQGKWGLKRDVTQHHPTDLKGEKTRGGPNEYPKSEDEGPYLLF